MAPGVDAASGAGIATAPGAVDAVDVILADRNRAPSVTSPLVDRRFEPGADAVTIDLADVFDDPNDDVLSYSLQPVPGSLVTLNGSVLTLTPGAPSPPVVVVVRATDPDGLTTTRTFSVTVAAGDRDYDTDDDNLIDVATLAQLDAVRYDLNGDGRVDAAAWQPYYAAFDEAKPGMGCPDACLGYELAADLDFDTDGSGAPDAGDDYWNAGAGWDPIGPDTDPFAATFEGNRRTVSQLFIDRDRQYVGLFGATGSSSVVRRVGLVDADVTGTDYVGALAGTNAGDVASSYATGRVAGADTIGGLVGDNAGIVAGSYATGRVLGDGAGGLAGAATSQGVFRSSYWDRETSGVRVGVGEDDLNGNGWLEAGEPPTPGVAGQSTAALQAPTGYDGIYATWNLDLDGDAAPDVPWFLQSTGSYPVLSSLDYAAGGYQLSRGPTLTAATSAGQAQVTLTWTALDASRFWVAGPDIACNLIRDDGATFELLVEEGAGLQHTDTDVTVGTTYNYQVAAVVQDGEATRSAVLPVVAGVGNQSPVAVGRLADRTLRVGGDAVIVDVAGAFLDPEDDVLDYAASSSATGVATVSVSGTEVTVTPAGEGAATITVTATDAAGSNTSAVQRFTVTVWSATAVDYDTDDDGLIEIDTLAQLDAVRRDLDGDGVPASGAASYRAAFADAVDRLGCAGIDGCTGYELAANLDFDTNGSGGPDAGDAYWNSGVGWEPIGTDSRPFAATFDGNGRTIANLFIDVDSVDRTGLFGQAGPSSRIRGVGLTGVAVRASEDLVGGLVGVNLGLVSGSYAAGRVTGDYFVGGLVGFLSGGTVEASYSTGPVSGTGDVGGLVGAISSISGGDVIASYWDTRISGLSGGGHGEGRSTAALQGPTSYAGLYLGRPQFSWTRIRGENPNVEGGRGHGSVKACEGSWVGADGGSPKGDRSRRRPSGGWRGGLGARATVEREPQTGRGCAAAARRVAGHGLA